MTNQTQRPNARKYDLEERTAGFGEAIIDFASKIAKIEVNRPLITKKEELRRLWQEAHELALIFSKISRRKP